MCLKRPKHLKLLNYAEQPIALKLGIAEKRICIEFSCLVDNNSEWPLLEHWLWNPQRDLFDEPNVCFRP